MNLNKQLLRYDVISNTDEGIEIKFIVDESIHIFDFKTNILHPDLEQFPIVKTHLSKTKELAFNMVGKTFVNEKINMSYTIIAYFNSRNVWVKFEDGYIKKHIIAKHIISGNVGNPNKKFEYKSTIKNKKAYNCWHNIKKRLIDNKDYQNVSLDLKWENYSIFEEWFTNNYIGDFHIDKDLYFIGSEKINKIYSDTTCCFLPKSINNLLQDNRDTALTAKGITKTGMNFTVKLQGQNYGTYSNIETAKNHYIEIKLDLINQYTEEYKNLLKIETYNKLKSITKQELKAFIYG